MTQKGGVQHVAFLMTRRRLWGQLETARGGLSFNILSPGSIAQVPSLAETVVEIINFEISRALIYMD